MRKITCIFSSVEEAEHAQKRLIKQCGGECRIKEVGVNARNEDNRFISIPSNYGMNNAPQTPADIGAWQISDIIGHSKNVGSKCRLTYIGFDDQAKQAESYLYNLHAENISVSAYPRG